MKSRTTTAELVRQIELMKALEKKIIPVNIPTKSWNSKTKRFE